MEYLNTLTVYLFFSITIYIYTLFFLDFDTYRRNVKRHFLYYILAELALVALLPLLAPYENKWMSSDFLNYTLLYSPLLVFISLENKSDPKNKVFVIISGLLLRTGISRIGNSIIVKCNLASTIWGNLISNLVLFVLYVPIYFLGSKKIAKSKDFVPTTKQVVMFAVITFITAPSAFLEKYVMNNPTAYIYYICLEITMILTVIFYQYYIYHSFKKKMEDSYEKKLMEERLNQYNNLKEIIDAMNIKSHDLKHQIKKYKDNNMINIEALESLEKTISQYDASIKTGYEPLDTILTEKSYICLKRNFDFHAYVDSKYFKIFSTIELNNLVGNALDNSIEYLSNCQEKEKYIRVRTFESDRFFKIVFENSCYSDIKFDKEGFPITIKDDKSLHGYGTKSISSVVSSHNGITTFLCENNTFKIIIVFPIKELEKIANSELKPAN